MWPTPTRNRIVVFDAESMQPLRSWNVTSPGRIAVDTDSTLWVMSGISSGTLTIQHYAADGTALAGALTLPAGTVPADIAVAPSGQILVADNGPSQQILVFNKDASGQPQAGAAIGTRNGMFHAVKGVPGNVRFNGITGIGVDPAGNLYVAQNGEGPRALGSASVGQGAVLESYVYSSHAFNWRLYGLTFVDSAAFDPATPNSVYTGSKRFTLDYNQPVGHEWSYAAFTLDRFDYPDDPAFHEPRGVRGEPMVRRINGQPFLYTLDPGAHYLNVYRFDAAHGEMAIPSGLLAQNPLPGTWPAAPADVWRMAVARQQWQRQRRRQRDQQQSVDRQHRRQWLLVGRHAGQRLARHAVERHPRDAVAGSRFRRQSDLHVRQFEDVRDAATVHADRADRLHRGDRHHVHLRLHAARSRGTRRIGRRRARCSRATTTGAPARRRNSTRSRCRGTRKAIRRRPRSASRWRATTSSSRSCTRQKVDVYDARTGQAVGYMTPGASVGNTSGWVDVYLGISAVQRDNGEYVVLLEDDARAKILMYRWTP